MRRLTRLLAILGLLAPATLPAQEPSVVTVTRGTVRDAVSNTPLVGAEVSALGTRGKTWTDNRGHFRLETPVRPDSLRIDPEGPIVGVVTARTFRRDHFLLEVKVADGPSLEVAVIGDRIPAAGDPVRLAADPAAIVPLP